MSLFGDDPHHRFFGTSSRAVSEIVMRRHPFSFTLYGIVTMLGTIYVFHLYGAGRGDHDLFGNTSEWAIFAWKWLMVSGGLGAILAVLLNPRLHPHWPDIVDLLHIEAIFAGTAAGGMAVYLAVDIHLQGVEQAYQATGIYGLLIAGHVWRSIQCARDANHLQDLQEALDAAAAPEHG